MREIEYGLRAPFARFQSQFGTTHDAGPRAGVLWVLTLSVFLGLLFAPASYGYSVLTHEAIVDSVWDSQIQKLLLQRFPGATAEELKQAHAYAYGGCIIQDLGYYPAGNKFFSNLVHYARSGDFIVALIRESQDMNEYAFALGALAHYAADNNGHRLATNRGVPVLFPELQRKFGDTVTYADNPAAHLKTEFAFDVLQVARGDYASDGYHSFIGFEVSKPVLERAFLDVYGLDLESLMPNIDHVIGTYRRTVSSLIPKATRVAWVSKKKEIAQRTPGVTRKKFLYNISRASYEKSWNKNFSEPGFGSKLLAFLLEIVPKVGPLKVLALRMPTPEVETMFMASFNATLDQYRHLLAEQSENRLSLINDNFDVGRVTEAGQYRLADDSYAELLDRLTEHGEAVDTALRSDILQYYGDLSGPISTKHDKRHWQKLVSQIEGLRNAKAAAEHPDDCTRCDLQTVGAAAK
jgi:hypothetical protein